MKIWTVDAFTEKLFEGNPAAVTILKEFPTDEICQKVAAELHLPAMAFLKPLGLDHFYIRWFTPAVEANLCGHATLASSHILFQENIVQGNQISFDSGAGPLFVQKEHDQIILNFPLQKVEDTLPPHLFEGLFEQGFLNAVTSCGDIIVELADENLVRNLNLNLSKVEEFDCRAMIVTAKGNAPYDMVSRMFAPRLGINEDPVCGSAHCKLADYWRQKLGKDDLLAYQASARGGTLGINIIGDRVHLKGKAVTVSEGTLAINL